MIDCLNVEMRERLPDLANETLSPELRGIVLAHVAGCAPCAAEIEILRGIRSIVIDATPKVNVAGIVKALPAAGSRTISRRRTSTSWRIAAAVTLFAAGAGSYAVLQQRSTLAPVDSTIVASAATIDTSAGLALAGGVADLSDAQAEALIDGLNKIEALPSPEVEPVSVGVSGTPELTIPDSLIRDLEDL